MLPSSISSAFPDTTSASPPCHELLCSEPYLHADCDRSRESIPAHLALESKPRKVVSFNEKVRAKKTIHINNFSSSELRDYWYSPKEFKKMRKTLLVDADTWEKSSPTEETAEPGLRIHTSLGSKNRSENKKRAISVVLEEQQLQWEEGSYDPEYIAELYKRASMGAKKTALKEAKSL